MVIVEAIKGGGGWQMGREEGRGLETGEYQRSRFCQRKKRWRKCGERDRKERCPVRKTEKSSKKGSGYLPYVPSIERVIKLRTENTVDLTCVFQAGLAPLTVMGCERVHLVELRHHLLLLRLLW